MKKELIEVGVFFENDSQSYQLDKSTHYCKQEKVTAFDLKCLILFEAALTSWRSMLQEP